MFGRRWKEKSDRESGEKREDFEAENLPSKFSFDESFENMFLMIPSRDYKSSGIYSIGEVRSEIEALAIFLRSLSLLRLLSLVNRL